MITPVIKRKSLGQILITKGLVTAQALDATLEQQKGSGRHQLLGEMLIEQGIITEEQLCETLSEMHDVPYAKVSPKICDPKVIEVLPREFIEKHSVLPMFLVNNVLTVALSEPSNLFLIEEIQQLTSYTVQVVASTQRDIAATLQAAEVITYRRGVIKILNRRGLEAASCECYEVAKTAYEAIVMK